MGKPEELEELEEIVSEDIKEKKRYERKSLDPKLVEKGIETIKLLDPSDFIVKLLDIVQPWNLKDDDETVKSNIAEIRKNFVESVGGSEKLKDTLEQEDIKKELENLNALAKTMPIINNITSYYARRANAGQRVRKAKYTQIRINNTTYQVNSEYYLSLSELSSAERQKMLLEHPDTKKIEIIEEF